MATTNLAAAERALAAGRSGGELTAAALQNEHRVSESQFHEAWEDLSSCKQEFINQRTMDALALSLTSNEPFSDLTTARTVAEATVATQKAAAKRSKADAEALRKEISDIVSTVAELHLKLQGRCGVLADAISGARIEEGDSALFIQLPGGTRLSSAPDALAFISTQVRVCTLHC